MSTEVVTHPISFRSQWARRLVRDKLVAEITELQKKNSPRPLHLLGAGPISPAQEVTPHNLPLDPNCTDGASSEARACKGLVEDAELPRRKVCIVGAGVAGLYIAMILDDLNIPNLTYDILESNTRIGGRLYTYNFSQTPHDYYDIGAMRYPDIPVMKRVFDLLRLTEMPLIRYHLDGGPACPKLFNDYFWSPDTEDPYHVSTKNGGLVSMKVVGRENDILEAAYGPYKKALAENFEEGYKKLMAVDEFSTREYLRRGGPDGTGEHYDFHSIQWMETQSTSTNTFDQGFSDMIFESFDFDYPLDKNRKVDWWCIEGGARKLTDAMASGLSHQVQMGMRVKAICIDKGSKQDGNMSVHCAGDSKPLEGYSTVFATASLGCLGRMDLQSLELHPFQKDAIRSVHYEDSTKVALKFSYPWWIKDCGITKGGVASTDLPPRTCVYPSYNLHDGIDKPAVLLASYTWAQDANRYQSLIRNSEKPHEEELVELVLHNLARLHAEHMTYEKIKEAFTGEYHAYSWNSDPHTVGAFATFSPGQFKNLYPYLCQPAADSKFHIVGEASSAHHGWVVGALDSAYAAVCRFLKRYELGEYQRRLKERWGEVGELETGENGTLHLQVAMGRKEVNL